MSLKLKIYGYIGFGALLVLGVVGWLVYRQDFQEQQSVADFAREVVVDTNQRYQTFTAWEATPQAAQTHYKDQMLNYEENPVFQKLKEDIYTKTVDLGINRVRLEIRSGIENPVDYPSQRIAGTIDRDTYRKYRYEIINDNADPFSIDPAGFVFSDLDDTIESMALPLKQRVEAKGERFYVNLCYVDFGSSTFEHFQDPEEFAELMQAVFVHIKSKYGFAPDTVEWLEPDNTPWTGTRIGQAIKASSGRLATFGFSPKYVVPSVTNINNALPYFNDILGVLGNSLASQNLAELSYHRYWGATPEALRAIRDRAKSLGIGTAHLELIGADDAALRADLTLADNTAWSQYTIAWPMSGGTDDGGKYFLIDDSNPDNPKLVMAERTRYLQQYMRYIRPGAVRVNARSADSTLEPVAFVNANNRPVVVVKAGLPGQVLVRGLTDGTYGVTYTGQSATLAALPDVTVENGQTVSLTLPISGVFTLFYKAAGTSGGNPPPTDGQYGEAPKIIKFTTEPSQVKAGAEVRLAWQTSGAEKVLIMPGLGEQAVSGQLTVKPSVDTTYALVVQNAFGEAVQELLVLVENDPDITPPPVTEPPPAPKLSVVFIAPESKQTVSGRVEVRAQIQAEAGLRSVKISVPNQAGLAVPTSLTPVYFWDTGRIGNGRYELLWQVEDNVGQKAEAKLSVAVLNQTTTPSPFLSEVPTIVPPAPQITAAKYATGALALEGGTVYWLNRTHKIPFTNAAAFTGLGYSFTNVISGADTSSLVLPRTYMIRAATEEHPWGSWLLASSGTVYYSHESGLIAVPSWEVFLGNGGQAKFLVPLNEADKSRLRAQSTLPLLKSADSRVVY